MSRLSVLGRTFQREDALSVLGRSQDVGAAQAMSETPRQNAQASRHARRQSPYTRVPAQESAAPSTPVRRRLAVAIGTLLTHSCGLHSHAYVAFSHTSRPFARGGRRKWRQHRRTNRKKGSESKPRLPRAPTPRAETTATAQSRNLHHPPVRLTSSTHPTRAFRLRLALVRMPFSHCTEINPPLTDVYRRDIDAPTAFTPHFRPATPTLATFNNPPAFGTTLEAPSNTPVFRRKRPLYVGAGYTGRRKRVVKPAPAEVAAGPDAAVSGKRRRLVTADDDVSPPIRSTGGSGHTSEIFGSVSPSRPLSLDAAANARSSTTDCACLGPFTS